MSKAIKVSVTCPKCAAKLAIPVTEYDLGTKKQCMCSNCHKIFFINVPLSLASKFESDPTCIGNTNNHENSLVIEVKPNKFTTYQSFELTSEYYTIGRKNSGGPEYRPDVEISTNDMKISRKHAIIKKRGNVGYTIKDNNSKNGVVLNTTKLAPDEELYLKDGDVFCLGETMFSVSIADKSIDSDDLTR